MMNRNKDAQNLHITANDSKPLVSGCTFRKHEAFRRMQNGEKVTHKSMLSNEYLYISKNDLNKSRVLTEDGYDFTEMFWFRNIAYYEYGWSQYSR